MSAEPAPLLVVEDNPVYAEILQRLLPALGAEMRFAPKCVDTAEKAIEEIAHTNYSLVILDYKLPGADGLSVLAHIRSLPIPRQPAVIMLTGMGNESVAVEAMKRGAKDYLPKDSLDVPSLLRAISSALERKQLELQVARFTEELREKNAQVEADLNMAREIQEAFLPERYPTFPNDALAKESALHFYHRYLPTGAVGGDFFDVLRISDTQAGVFICDVMGHGVRAALVTAMVRALAEELVSAAAKPDKFLVEINRRLLGILTQTRMPMFASAFYLVVDLARGELRYSSAGHPSPLLVRRSAGTVEALRFAGGPARRSACSRSPCTRFPVSGGGAGFGRAVYGRLVRGGGRGRRRIRPGTIAGGGDQAEPVAGRAVVRRIAGGCPKACRQPRVRGRRLHRGRGSGPRRPDRKRPRRRMNRFLAGNGSN